MRVIGIDPGKSGAAACIEVGTGDIFGPRPEVRTVDITDFSIVQSTRQIDVLAFRRWLHAHHADHAFIEAVHSMPRDGKVQAFSFGKTAGLLEATLILNNLEPEGVQPAVWKEHFSLINQPKDAARHRAMKLMPDASKWLQRIKDGGRADSLLLAMYGAERMLGRHRITAMTKEASNNASPATRSPA